MATHYDRPDLPELLGTPFHVGGKPLPLWGWPMNKMRLYNPTSGPWMPAPGLGRQYRIERVIVSTSATSVLAFWGGQLGPMIWETEVPAGVSVVRFANNADKIRSGTPVGENKILFVTAPPTIKRLDVHGYLVAWVRE